MPRVSPECPGHFLYALRAHSGTLHTPRATLLRTPRFRGHSRGHSYRENTSVQYARNFLRKLTTLVGKRGKLWTSALIKHRQVTDLDVTVWGFRGPGFRSALQVLCGDASRLSLDHFSKHVSSVLGGQSSVTRSGIPGAETPNHPQRKAPFGTVWPLLSNRLTKIN